MEGRLDAPQTNSGFVDVRDVADGPRECSGGARQAGSRNDGNDGGEHDQLASCEHGTPYPDPTASMWLDTMFARWKRG